MKTNTYYFTSWLLGLGFLFLAIVYGCQENKNSFAIGVIADCQYCNDPGQGVRKYASSANKLKKCVNHFNSLNLEFVIHLGDFIDRDFESFDVVKPIYNQLVMPKYHVLGNHDFSVAEEKKNDIPKVMGLSSRYYDFELFGWRFVVLDGNDISFHAYPEDSEEFKNALEYYEKNEIKSPKWNGAIGKKQLSWLNNVLQDATKSGEKVVLYCHFPLFPENVHNLWNAKEIIDLIEKYSCVKAFVNGHNHGGNYGNKNGIHYLTLKGMVDTEETSYAIINFSNNQLKVSGFGREEDRIMEIRE